MVGYQLGQLPFCFCSVGHSFLDSIGVINPSLLSTVPHSTNRGRAFAFALHRQLSERSLIAKDLKWVEGVLMSMLGAWGKVSKDTMP